MRTKTNIKKIEVLKPTTVLARNKKGAVPLVVMGLAVLGGAVLLYGGYKYYIGKDSGAMKAQIVEKVQMPDGSTKEVIKEQPLVISQNTQNNCGDAKTTSFDAVAINPLDQDGTPTYPAVALKIKALGGSGAWRSYTTDTDGTFASSSLGLNCGTEYEMYAPASINSTSSAKMKFTTDGPTHDEQFNINSLDFIQVRTYDNINHGNVYDSADASATDYEDLTSASLTLKSTTSNATAYAMGVGSELDWTFSMKVDAQKSWGDIENYIAVDADTSDYTKPVLTFNGVTLEEVGKGALHPDDQGYLSSYEYIYRLPQGITETSSDLRIKVGAKSSVNPDVDIVVRPIAKSYWLDGTTMKERIFKSDGTEILMTARTITADIS